MAIVLYMEESKDQIVAGFPEYIIFTTNIPATIFYTLDGSDPDPLTSDMYADGMLKLTLPTEGTTLTIKAMAVAGLDESAIMEEIYFTDQKKIDKNRLIGKEGIRVLPAGGVPINNLSYDTDGNPSQQSVIPIEKMDLKASTTNNRGEVIPNGSTLDFVNFPIKNPYESRPLVSSPNNNNINFDPKAAYIMIDGSTEAKLNSQIVRIINRPSGTMELVSPIYNRNMQSFQLNTSGFVRYMISPNRDKICLYYRDSREGRWIRSTQHIKYNTLNLTPTASPPSSFVFRWVENRAQTKIY